MKPDGNFKTVTCETLIVSSPYDDSRVQITSNPVGIYITVYNQASKPVIHIDIDKGGAGHVSTHLSDGSDKGSL